MGVRHQNPSLGRPQSTSSATLPDLSQNIQNKEQLPSIVNPALSDDGDCARRGGQWKCHRKFGGGSLGEGTIMQLDVCAIGCGGPIVVVMA